MDPFLQCTATLQQLFEQERTLRIAAEFKCSQLQAELNLFKAAAAAVPYQQPAGNSPMQGAPPAPGCSGGQQCTDPSAFPRGVKTKVSDNNSVHEGSNPIVEGSTPRAAAADTAIGKEPLHAEDQHNDSCDACEKGGDLLCCDFCSLVFHLECLKPPLQVTHYSADLLAVTCSAGGTGGPVGMSCV